MSIGPFKQRSSWPSSFVTGLIGWIGFFVIVAVIFGEIASAGTIFLFAVAAAITQVLVLRLLFFLLRMDKSLLTGGLWGGVTAIVLMLIEMQLTNIFDAHPIIWLLNALYIGVAVGLFLSYFYRDDRRIENEAQTNGVPVDYGRDAHWLEPFFFGAAAHLIAFVPTSFEMGVIALVIGAISGVVAAGVSHFFIFTIARTSWLPIVLCILVGIAQGAITGLLFRTYSVDMVWSPLIHGAVAGGLTYLMAAFRGSSLANKEMAADVR